VAASAGGSTEAAMMDFAAARRAMVDSQVRTSDVTDLALIAAMLAIPRERFVPDAMVPLAYLDRDLPLDGRGAGASRWLMKPMVLARLIQAADPRPQDRVLVVACGTGYGAAVLARLAATVVALEEDPGLAERARASLAAVGAGNVTVVTGPLDRGWPGPHDVVLIDGGVETVPQALFDAMAPGGRLVAVVSAGPVGKAMCFQSINAEVGGRPLFDATLPVLPGFKKAPAFVF
jgi:protein-L-isoaspartate(D-aspartate) O-methyltransferase